MRIRLVSLLAASALALTACGGGGGSITKVGSPESSGSETTGDVCETLESTDGPGDGFVRSVPEEHRTAATALVDFVDALDSMGDNASDIDPSQLADILTTDGLPDDLEAFAAYAEQECGATDGLSAIRAVASAATVAGADQLPEYCEALDSRFINGDEGPSTLTELADIAPAEHADALAQLAAANPEQMSGSEGEELFGPIFGIGVYAESVCGIEGALSQTLFGLLFMGMGGDESTGGNGGDGTIPGVDPTQYPDITADAANAALPAGASISFSVVTVDLEDGDGYLASMVVPSDWDYDTNFDVEFAPADGSGGFTSLSAGAGCDGTCEPMDWDARLRGEGGAIANFTSNHPSATEAPIAGSKGVVLTDTTDGANALVLRWDDRADKYFSCEVDLEDEYVPLLPAFVTACTSSTPAWFPVG